MFGSSNHICVPVFLLVISIAWVFFLPRVQTLCFLAWCTSQLDHGIASLPKQGCTTLPATDADSLTPEPRRRGSVNGELHHGTNGNLQMSWYLIVIRWYHTPLPWKWTCQEWMFHDVPGSPEISPLLSPKHQAAGRRCRSLRLCRHLGTRKVWFGFP